MSDGFLSQEEIDALLRGDTFPSEPAAELSEIESDALGEIGNICMGSAATTLSILVGRRVSITTPRVSVSSLKDIRQEYPLPYIIIEVAYMQGLPGTNLFAIREQDGLVIADLMMGGDGSNPPQMLSELYMSAVTEAMNQMMGSTATSMSSMFKKRIDISPPSVFIQDFSREDSQSNISRNGDPVVVVAFRMEVEGLIDSEIMQIVPMTVAKEMVGSLITAVQPPSEPAPPAPKAAAPRTPSTPPPVRASAPPPPRHQAQQQPAPNVVVQPAQFAPLKPSSLPTVDANISLIMDVPLQITVELGRTRKLIRDILELAPGSVVELDKLAGEAVDILANGKLIAKGEVVVIDENFGVRITDIISPLERAHSLQ